MSAQCGLPARPVTKVAPAAAATRASGPEKSVCMRALPAPFNRHAARNGVVADVIRRPKSRKPCVEKTGHLRALREPDAE
jgi:hypothetical protein